MPATARDHGRAQLVAGMAATAAALVAIVAIPPLRHSVSLTLHADFSGLREYIRSLQAGGVALLVALMLGHAIVFYPSEIITATAAYVYGFVPGLAIVIVGWLLAALVSYALGRAVGRPLLSRLLGRRFTALKRTFHRGGAALLLSGRLIPVVPFAFLGYATGAARVSLWRFAWTTVVGYLPLTAAVAYLGASAETLSAGNPWLWLAVGAVIASLVAEHALRRGRGRRR